MVDCRVTGFKASSATKIELLPKRELFVFFFFFKFLIIHSFGESSIALVQGLQLL